MKSEKVRLVVSQTNYDAEEARERLEHHGWDCKKTIRAYLGGGASAPASASESKSTNQQIFSSIRKLMDDSSRAYYQKNG